jgi:hypothetical protein
MNEKRLERECKNYRPVIGNSLTENKRKVKDEDGCVIFLCLNSDEFFTHKRNNCITCKNFNNEK